MPTSDGKWQFWGSIFAALIGLFGTIYGIQASKEEKRINQSLQAERQVSQSLQAKQEVNQKDFQQLQDRYDS